MRKLLATAIALLAASTTALPQPSLSVTNAYVTGNPAILLQGHATVTNNSALPKDVAVCRTVNNLFPGHVGYFCWFECYPPGTSVSPDFLTIPPNSSVNLFQADVETNAIPGISLNTYCFYDVNNPADSACVDLVFDASQTASDPQQNTHALTNPFPNPATITATVPVNAPMSRTATLTVYGPDGSKSMEIRFDPKEKPSLSIDVSRLPTGIYTYRLEADGEKPSTGKIQVSR